MKGRLFLNPVKLVLSFTLALTLGFAGVGAVGGFALAQSSAQDVNRRIVINIPSRTLWVYEGDRIVRWFPVGVGRAGFQTPLGKYKVIRKIVNPIWEHPYKAAGAVRIAAGPRNPLGTRWIGFKEYKGGEYGIHGTDRPSSVGKFSSHGCVRMKIKDAEALFGMVELGTPVDVTYQTVLVRPQGNQMRLVVYPDAFGKGMPSVAQVKEMILDQHPAAVVDDAKISQALRAPTQSPVVVGQTEGADMAEQAPAPKTPAEADAAPTSGQPEALLKLNHQARQEKPEPSAIPKAETTRAVPIPPPSPTARPAFVSPMGQLEASVRRDFPFAAAR